MTRKLLTLVLAVAVIVSLVIAGCAKPAPAPTPAPTPAPSPAPAPKEVITWKIQGITPAGLAFHDLLLHLADWVEQASDGRLVFDVYPSGAVCPPLESLDAVNAGVLDAVYDYSGMWIGKHKTAPLFCSTPGVLDAWDRVMWEWEGGGKELREELYTKVIGMDVHPIVAGAFGPELFMWSNTPLRTIDDFKGKNLRMMPLMGEVLNENGISTVFLPYAEIIPALERGVLDACEYSLPFFDITAGFPDVCQYYHYPGIHQPSSMQEIVINGDSWRALPDDLKTKLELVCHAQTLWCWHYTDALNIEALEEFDKMGREEVLLDPETVDIMLGWAYDYLDKEAAKDPFFAKVWNSQKEWRDRWYPYADAIYFSHKL